MSTPMEEPYDEGVARVLDEQAELVLSMNDTDDEDWRGRDRPFRRDRPFLRDLRPRHDHCAPNPCDLLEDVLGCSTGLAWKLLSEAGSIAGALATSTLEAITDGGRFCDRDDRRGPPILALPAACPGGRTSRWFSVTNPTRDYFDHIHLRCDALVGAGSRHIDGSHITFDPHHMNVRPHGSVRATVAVAVPDDAQRGSYVGVLTIPGYRGIRMLLTVDVV